MSHRGFTIVEVVLVVGLLGIIVPVVGATTRQILVQTSRDTTRITALTALENTGRWLGRDIPLAQTTDVVNLAPPVAQISLYWTDWSDSGNYDQYAATSNAFKRVRATYTLSGVILTRAMATCANTLDSDVLCVTQVVSGTEWTNVNSPNTKWVSGQTVLTCSGACTFNAASRTADPASPFPVSRNLATFQVSRAGSAITVAVTSFPKGSGWPGAARTYEVNGALLSSVDPIQ